MIKDKLLTKTIKSNCDNYITYKITFDFDGNREVLLQQRDSLAHMDRYEVIDISDTLGIDFLRSDSIITLYEKILEKINIYDVKQSESYYMQLLDVGFSLET